MAIDWITIDKAKGDGDATLGVSVSSNALTSSRSARIKITSTDGSIVKYVSVIEEGKEEDYLNVSPSTIGFPKDGGTDTISIGTNGTWTITAPDWITISKSTGNGNATLTVSASNNTTGEDLEGEIIIRVGDLSKIINVRQGDNVDYLITSLDGIGYGYKGGEYPGNPITIKSNMSWTLTYPDWITVTPTSGDGDGEFNVVFTENTTGEDRMDIITVKGERLTKYITVVQFKDGTVKHLSVVPETITFEGDGGESEIFVYSDWHWIVKSKPDWITLDKTYGFTSDKIKVTAQSSDIDREDEIIISTYPESLITKTVKVYQSVVNSNKIVYTSTNGQLAYPSGHWGATSYEYYYITNKDGSINKLTSNTYEDGKGIWIFESAITFLNIKSDLQYNIKSLRIPNSVVEIAENCCKKFDKMETINIGNSVKTIGNFAFQFCSSLQSINLPSTLTSIGNYAFQQCDLQSVVLPSGLTYLGSGALVDNNDITEINVPIGITKLNAFVFGGTGIKEMEIPITVTELGNGVFDNCKSLVSVSIPSTIAKIPDYLFRLCSSLTTLTIPDSITSLGSMCFDRSGITAIYAMPDTAPTVIKNSETDNSFYNIPYDGTLHYPSGSDYSTWTDQLGSGWTAIADL